MANEPVISHYGIAALLIRGVCSLVMIFELVGLYLLMIFGEAPQSVLQGSPLRYALVGEALVLAVISLVLNGKLKQPLLRGFLSLLDCAVVASGFLIGYAENNPHLVIPFFIVGMMNTIIGLRRDCMA